MSGCRDLPWSCASLMCPHSAPWYSSFAFDIMVYCLAFQGEERGSLPVFVMPHSNGNNEIIQYFKHWKGFRPIYALILDFFICDYSRRKVKKK